MPHTSRFHRGEHIVASLGAANDLASRSPPSGNGARQRTSEYRRSGMYAFLLRPRWILFHVVVIAAIVGMLAASRWQWDKYNARDEFIATVEKRQDREQTPPVPLTSILAGNSVSAIEYRTATATGSYLPTGQLVQINRTQDGVNGVNVLSPFQIDGGPVVIVNRGFVPDGVKTPPPPTARLVLGGTVRASQQRRTGELTDASGDVAEVRRVELPLIAARLGIEIAPVYLDLIASDPAATEPPTPVPPPDLTGGPPHLSYTIQWLVFSACAAIGWVLAVRRSLHTRTRALAATPPVTLSEDGGIPARPSV